jgi:glycosyltransferase involved in cell wall biosynthesis
MQAFLESPFSQASVQDLGFNVFEYPIYDVCNRISIAHSNRIISCSYAVLNELRTIYKHLDLEKSSVIYNGIDIGEFDNIRNNMVFREKTEDYAILFFGRLFWSKGISYLLAAFKLLLNEYPTLHLRLCGKGPMEPKIRAFISRENLTDNVHILGHVSRRELLTEIISADVVVLPSLREAQPISVLEAMACRKPVVAFNLPFAYEYIQDSYNGLLARARDSRDLAKKIGILLSNNDLRNSLGKNAYEFVLKHHNWDNLVNKYIDVYKKVIYQNSSF